MTMRELAREQLQKDGYTEEVIALALSKFDQAHPGVADRIIPPHLLKAAREAARLSALQIKSMTPEQIHAENAEVYRRIAINSN